ncbi:hypothetical protein [Nitrosomonas supralitoralis]|uniref:Terminase n=1 Tax=Nitrosomonas supralitoralis TaxID=2116706 RepID=A0A2P7NTU3_9PROT|nr:hypothetical protein [Nitrosomonas supralitoralis]PSJ16890.1 hypothetical protein C7H79_11040 [Nitrosomonas supralitoralis]
MAAKPKLTQEEWDAVRTAWEFDPREGYSWLVTELNLPVSRPAIGKVAAREGWKKSKVTQKSETIKESAAEKPSKPKLQKAQSKKSAAKVTKVTQNYSETLSKTISETMEKPSKKKGGQPSLYREEYAKQVHRLSLLGTTDEEIAIYFDVAEQTINNWKKEHPEFLESMNRGKLESDSRIAKATYKSALGKHYVEEEKVVGNEVVMTKRQIPPDVSAQRMWLFNRRPKQWKNKIELKEEINLNVFPPKEELDAIYAKALEDARKVNETLLGRRERLGVVIDNETGLIDDDL